MIKSSVPRISPALTAPLEMTTPLPSVARTTSLAPAIQFRPPLPPWRAAAPPPARDPLPPPLARLSRLFARLVKPRHASEDEFEPDSGAGEGRDHAAFEGEG